MPKLYRHSKLSLDIPFEALILLPNVKDEGQVHYFYQKVIEVFVLSKFNQQRFDI